MGTYKLSSELPSDIKVHGLVPATTPTKHTDTLEARINILYYDNGESFQLGRKQKGL